MKTAEEILKRKLTFQAMLANDPNYTFEKIIEALIELADQSYTAGYHFGISQSNVPELDDHLFPDKKNYLNSIKCESSPADTSIVSEAWAACINWMRDESCPDLQQYLKSLQ